MEDPTSPVAQTEVHAPVDTERQRVTQWRIERLLEVGYDDESALLIGLDRSIDLHLAVELLRRGCPVDTALQILF